jgi:AbrB family looped-hinge helix DNA binding protein
MIGKATLTSKGQLTVPVEVRRALRLRQGDRLIFERHPEGVLIRRAGRAADLLGVVPPLPVDWETMRRKAWGERAERLAAQGRRGRSSATRTS